MKCGSTYSKRSSWSCSFSEGVPIDKREDPKKSSMESASRLIEIEERDGGGRDLREYGRLTKKERRRRKSVTDQSASAGEERVD